MNEYLAALVDELHSLGLRHAVFSPGSRSTALALLFQEHKEFHTYMNIDERSAAFFALGIAKVSHQPVVLVCTSGSALGHYMPAIMEAKLSRIPLIILSADRPPELYHVGAPQTLDQSKFFGIYVNHYEELAVPEQADFYTYPRKVAQKAYLKAMSLVKGPVHINIPLREPLIPSLDKDIFTRGRAKHPFRFYGGQVHGQWSKEFEQFLQNKKVLILAGPDSSSDYQAHIVQLADSLKAPIIADPLSNMRSFSYDYLMDAYDVFLKDSKIREELRPDCIIQLGQIPVSKRLQQFMAALDDVVTIQVDPSGDYRNPTLTTTAFVQASIGDFCQSMNVLNLDARYAETWLAYNKKARKQLNLVLGEPRLFEGKLVALLAEKMPKHSQLLTANSMSVRNIDYFWKSGNERVYIYGNRGTNGIDGTLSTALGMATNGKKTVMVTGDLSFFHDLNGLALAKTHDLDLTIILFNNDGGGIFQYLPQKSAPNFDYLFSTPQGLDYSGLETLYGIHFNRVDSYKAYIQALDKAFSSKGVHLIEIKTDKEMSPSLHGKYAVMP